MAGRPLVGITGDIDVREDKTYLYIDIRYGRMIEECGGIPLLLHPTESVKEIISKIDGLLLSGGEDIHPRYYNEEPKYPMELSPDIRTDFEIALVKEAIGKRIPILGICHGMQLINIALGGTLYQDLPSQKKDAMEHRLRDRTHPVFIEERSKLFGMLEKNEIDVTSTHHQAIKGLGKGLIVCASAEDGVIEAFEKEDYPFLIGVQWHPEKTPDEISRKLFNPLIHPEFF